MRAGRSASRSVARVISVRGIDADGRPNSDSDRIRPGRSIFISLDVRAAVSAAAVAVAAAGSGGGGGRWAVQW